MTTHPASTTPRSGTWVHGTRTVPRSSVISGSDPGSLCTAIATAGPPLTLSDDFGQAYDIYGDVSGILNVINTDGPNVFVKGGVQFNDDFVTGNVQGGVGFEF